VERAIRSVVAADRDVRAIRELYTMNLGPRRILIVLGVTFARDQTGEEVAETIGRLQEHVIVRLDGLTDRRLVVIEPAAASSPASRRARAVLRR
jgi:hypothetical protein